MLGVGDKLSHHLESAVIEIGVESVHDRGNLQTEINGDPLDIGPVLDVAFRLGRRSSSTWRRTRTSASPWLSWPPVVFVV